MKKHKSFLLSTMLILFILSTTAYPSTAFMAVNGGKVLMGRNGDSSNSNVRMKVVSPSEGKYGIIYLGAEDIGGFYHTTAINDQGLWYGSTGLYDGAAFPERHDILNYYNKPTWYYGVIVKVLEECATIDEAIEIYSSYFL